ncbi:MAG: penicillin-binding protein 2 [Actinobacteria bacterium]|nr:penicillin-binding protein 2 [Actinomycetota bacterium]
MTPASVRRRVVWFFVSLSLAYVAIGWRLVEVQALSADRYAALGRSQRVRQVELAAERGTIFDRDGNELALSIPQQTVWADPRLVDDPAAYARQLAPLLAGPGGPSERGVGPVQQAELERTLLERLSKRGAGFVYLQRKVDDETAAKVAALQLPGVDFVPESKRHYPSDLAASTLGLVGTDNEGLGGLELKYEDLLSGRPGELVVERDPQGREIPLGMKRYTPPEPGSDLVLTIDHGIQFEAERALKSAVDEFGAKGGRAVVVDIGTGDILAMANVTAGHDGRPTGPDGHEERNRAVTDVYEPGSTNKVITVAGAIEEGLVSPDTGFVVPDHLAVADHVFSDHDPHPTETYSVRRILVESSNIGAIMIGKTLGKVRLDRYLREFGFGKETGLDFPGEPAGLLLDPDDWYPTSIGTVPIGNGLAVTALQMIDVYATVANQGVLREPRLVRATVDADGERHDRPLGSTRRVITEQTAELMRSMLIDVVREGTGTKAAIPGYLVAGKTGTARKPFENGRGYYDDRYMASFAGFAPADEPRLAAIVVIDEPSGVYGGIVAAPAFARIMQHALRIEGVPPVPGVGVPEEPPPAPKPVVTGDDVA